MVGHFLLTYNILLVSFKENQSASLNIHTLSQCRKVQGTYTVKTPMMHDLYALYCSHGLVSDNSLAGTKFLFQSFTGYGVMQDKKNPLLVCSSDEILLQTLIHKVHLFKIKFF
jgi:hypothetical protein